MVINLIKEDKLADITMCRDKACSRKYDCYRFTAPENPWRQSFFAESPREKDKFHCDEFWDNKGRRLDEKFREYERDDN